MNSAYKLASNVIVFSVLLFFIQFSCCLASIPESVLCDFVASTNVHEVLQTWNCNSRQKPVSPVCVGSRSYWSGITCSNGNIIEINLSNQNIAGTIPDSISKLTSLQKLNLESNLFIGILPENIGKMTSLKELNLNHNSFSGVVPYSLCEISSLNKLIIANGETQSNPNLKCYHKCLSSVAETGFGKLPQCSTCNISFKN